MNNFTIKAFCLVGVFLAFRTATACDIPFKAATSDSNANNVYSVSCSGPFSRMGTMNKIPSTTETEFYCADANIFSPYGNWQCSVTTVDGAYFKDKIIFDLVEIPSTPPVDLTVDINGCAQVNGPVQNVTHGDGDNPCIQKR